MTKGKPAYNAFFVLGLVFLILAFTNNMAFLGVGVVFFVIGASARAKGKKAAKDAKTD